ncbi:LOW QUALITY PROTEIN: microfibril-associated glycoprotein 4-like [Anableps anableps]
MKNPKAVPINCGPDVEIQELEDICVSVTFSIMAGQFILSVERWAKLSRVPPFQVTLLLALLLLVASVQSNSHIYLLVDCDDIYQDNNKNSSGVYTIYPGGPTTPLHVYCDMETDGGWTFRYGISFMSTWRTESMGKKYSFFPIDSENPGYQLHLGSFTRGTAADSLSNQNPMKFTTLDKDQDQWDKNCTQQYLGGFLFNACHMANPTGMYAPHGAIGFENVDMIWHTWKGWNYSLKSIVIKIRPTATCSCIV